MPLLFISADFPERHAFRKHEKVVLHNTTVSFPRLDFQKHALAVFKTMAMLSSTIQKQNDPRRTRSGTRPCCATFQPPKIFAKSLRLIDYPSFGLSKNTNFFDFQRLYLSKWHQREQGRVEHLLPEHNTTLNTGLANHNWNCRTWTSSIVTCMKAMVNDFQIDTGLFLTRQFSKISNSESGIIVLSGFVTPIALRTGLSLKEYEVAQDKNKVDLATCQAHEDDHENGRPGKHRPTMSSPTTVQLHRHLLLIMRPDRPVDLGPMPQPPTPCKRSLINNNNSSTSKQSSVISRHSSKTPLTTWPTSSIACTIGS
ncbi:hypothetical protein Salat_1153600 [Sesamum alatum]|uniref:Uncharacterized protein n=1 Tax=Sesamum alatum TaxID=300844 RepID=A0AAE2CNC3_9LAMI|nr:hypothetical protein Salat_1153600 [Sesamum alatum]